MPGIAVLGANGRMGQALVRLLAGHPTLKLTGVSTEPGHSTLGVDAGALAGLSPVGVPLTDDVTRAIRGCAVAVDFTAPVATARHAQACAAAGCALVVGTTGLGTAEQSALDRAAASIPVLHARNMSLGVTVLTELAREATRLLGPEFDVEITEAHHRHKKDAPSGTALQLGEAVATARGKALAELAVYDRHGIGEGRPTGAIGFAVVRAGAIVGDHSVLLVGPEETVELRHHASDRALFARGALRAAEWLTGRRPGRYSLRDVLGLDPAAR